MFNVQGGRKPCDAKNKKLDNLRMTNETKGLKYSTFLQNIYSTLGKEWCRIFFATIFNYNGKSNTFNWKKSKFWNRLK